jgi:TonB family protein
MRPALPLKMTILDPPIIAMPAIGAGWPTGWRAPLGALRPRRGRRLGPRLAISALLHLALLLLVILLAIRHPAQEVALSPPSFRLVMEPGPPPGAPGESVPTQPRPPATARSETAPAPPSTQSPPTASLPPSRPAPPLPTPPLPTPRAAIPPPSPSPSVPMPLRPTTTPSQSAAVPPAPARPPQSMSATRTVPTPPVPMPPSVAELPRPVAPPAPPQPSAAAPPQSAARQAGPAPPRTVTALPEPVPGGAEPVPVPPATASAQPIPNPTPSPATTRPPASVPRSSPAPAAQPPQSVAMLPQPVPMPAIPSPPPIHEEEPTVRLALAPPLQEVLIPPPIPVPTPEPLPQPVPRPAPRAAAEPHRSTAFPTPMDLSFNTASADPAPRGTHGGGGIDTTLDKATLNSRGATPSDPDAAESMIHVRGAHVGKDWIALLHEWWEAHAYYPDQAVRRLEDGTVQIHLHVDRWGHVRLVELTSTSGSQWLDAGALAVFRNATLPPFPLSTPENDADIDLTIDYILVRR